jgi:hypothetical protein
MWRARQCQADTGGGYPLWALVFLDNPRGKRLVTLFLCVKMFVFQVSSVTEFVILRALDWLLFEGSLLYLFRKVSFLSMACLY